MTSAAGGAFNLASALQRTFSMCADGNSLAPHGSGLLPFAALTALLVLTSGVVPTRAQEAPRPTFRTRVAVVPITAVVRDARNRVITGLQREDFRVFEEGKPRRIVEFSGDHAGSVSIAVLFDTSGSMGLASNLAKGRAVVSRLLERMAPGRDEIALFTFHKVLREEVPYTTDGARVRAALGRVMPWGMTSLYDAVVETARRVSERPMPQRAIVVISDGLDTGSTLAAREAARLASDIDVPVYVVAVVSPLDDPTHALTVVPPTPAGGLRELAESTGGDSMHVSAGDASDAAEALLATLRHQYLLAIESSSVPGTYALQVRTIRKGTQVRARRAYVTDFGEQR